MNCSFTVEYNQQEVRIKRRKNVKKENKNIFVGIGEKLYDTLRAVQRLPCDGEELQGHKLRTRHRI